MTLLRDQALSGNVTRAYHIQVPANPVQAALPVIIVFHGGGQDAATIAARWGVHPPNPVPPDLTEELPAGVPRGRSHAARRVGALQRR